eukprot:SAG31_NODE_893_length_11177_cov_10.241806_10_plen_74_part_00
MRQPDCTDEYPAVLIGTAGCAYSRTLSTTIVHIRLYTLILGWGEIVVESTIKKNLDTEIVIRSTWVIVYLKVI